MKISGLRGPTDTPCVGVCTTTALGDDVCKGCGRLAEEVILWHQMTAQEKQKINERLKNFKLGIYNPKNKE